MGRAKELLNIKKKGHEGTSQTHRDDVIYMNSVGLPKVLDDLLQRVLAEQPKNKTGILSVIKEACEEMLKECDPPILPLPALVIPSRSPHPDSPSHSTNSRIRNALAPLLAHVDNVADYVSCVLTAITGAWSQGSVVDAAQKWCSSLPSLSVPSGILRKESTHDRLPPRSPRFQEDEASSSPPRSPKGKRELKIQTTGIESNSNCNSPLHSPKFAHSPAHGLHKGVSSRRMLGLKKAPVYRVVVTGGPCAGKSTGMSAIREQLEKHGFNVFVVPEAATILIDAGSRLVFQDATDDKIFVFQLALLRTQLRLEDSLYQIARACGKKAVVLCDRGTMDGRAFCTPELWDRILAEGSWTTGALRDARYDLVIHLVTAADGAEPFYHTENNKARRETTEEARAQDVRLRQMWLGHPRHRIIDNTTGFEEKIERALQSIMQLVGVDHTPGPILKYELLKAIPRDQIPVPVDEVTVTINILRGSTRECIVRLYRRSDGVNAAYTKQTLRRIGTFVQRIEEGLTEKSYLTLVELSDPEHEVTEKQLLCFVDGKQRYELGTTLHPESEAGKCYLYAETERDEHSNPKPVTIPSWLLEKTSVVEVQDLQKKNSLRRASCAPAHAARMSIMSHDFDGQSDDEFMDEEDAMKALNETTNWMNFPRDPFETSPQSDPFVQTSGARSSVPAAVPP